MGKTKTTTENERPVRTTRAEKARIASKAQAMAHQALRDKDPERYRLEYQKAKAELEAETSG